MSGEPAAGEDTPEQAMQPLDLGHRFLKVFIQHEASTWRLLGRIQKEPLRREDRREAFILCRNCLCHTLTCFCALSLARRLLW